MKAPKVKPGDIVAIISPSNTVSNRKAEIEKARQRFEELTSLETILSPNALAQHHYSAGTAQQRVDDFHWALKNPDVKAIVFSVGGNTAIELVASLDYELIRQNPKIISGISDATTLLNSITAKTELVTFLGLEFLDFAQEPMTYEVQSIKKAWFDGSLGQIQANPNWKDFDDTYTSYAGWKTIREGQAEGMIIGGNYESFAQLYHTPYIPNIEGSILVMEHYKKNKKYIQQAMAQLKLWGAFEKIAGIIMGYNLDNDNPSTVGNDRPLRDLMLETTQDYKFPIIWVGEVGHNVENFMLPIGARAKIDATAKTIEIVDRVVE